MARMSCSRSTGSRARRAYAAPTSRRNWSAQSRTRGLCSRGKVGVMLEPRAAEREGINRLQAVQR
jgi:hypothetical protein